jgi:hypothetical protein
MRPLLVLALAMFQPASEYREVYHALLNTEGWPIFRPRLEEMFDEIIRRECKAEIQRLKKPDSDVPVDLFVHYLTASDSSLLLSLDVVARPTKPTAAVTNKSDLSLVLPTVDAVLSQLPA